MEGVYGFRCQPCRDGGSHAGHARDFSRYPARDWSVYAAGRVYRFSVSRQPLGLGVGHRVDLGTAGFGARIPWGRDRMRRPEMGRGRVAVATVAIFSVVVIGANSRASVRHHPHP